MTMMNRMIPALLLSAVVALAFAGFASAEEAWPEELPPYGEDKPLAVPEILALTLDNQLTVWIAPRPGLPKVTAQLVVQGGEAVDPPQLGGLTEVLADALKGGTAKRDARQLAEEVQATGGSIDSWTNADAIYLRVQGFSTESDRLLEILADIALNASFPDSEVELARTNAIEALKAREATPEQQVNKALAASLFGAHPYGRPYPEKASLEAVTPTEVRKSFAERCRPERALLLIGGKVDPEALAARVRHFFAGWQGRGAAPELPKAAPREAARRFLLVDRPGSVQSEIRFGRPALTVTHPDYYPLLVANTLYGGSFSSRLTQNLREDKGYSYSPQSSLRSWRMGGQMMISVPARNEVTAAVLLEVLYELDRMGATAPSDDELSRAKRYLIGIDALRYQTQRSMLANLATNWLHGLPPEALANVVTAVQAVTAEQVRDVGRRYFASRFQTVVVGGDAATIGEQIEQFGAFEVLR